ncbi:hypothetical protein E2P81_ATG08759 [Venturia nashicola]|uniref:Myb-like domain-containing protein n=1 Tax=Venturia nashicola TaxID=86259 RepID=A0A4Z1NNT2_9PEZI|nr:hypothetical protein E6O75_ATG08954 [Venturia nashicola]TLD23415.1 hypothetical protein E2P81_ATG08759 [Venturia nashicola]
MSSNVFNLDLSQLSQPSSSADQTANAFVYAPLDTQYFSQQDHQNAFNIDYGIQFIPPPFSGVHCYTSTALDQEYSIPLPTTEASFPNLQHSPYLHIGSPAAYSNSPSPILLPTATAEAALSHDQARPSVFPAATGMFKSMKSLYHGSENSPQSIHSMPDLYAGPPSSSPESCFEPRRLHHLHMTIPTPAATPIHRGKESVSSMPRQRQWELPVRKQPVPILPNPDGPFPAIGQKRSASQAEMTPDTRPAKLRRGSSLSPSNIELKEEEVLLHQFREEGCSWKETANKLNKETGHQLKVPALQMRLKRLYERLREWSEADVQALRLAVEWHQNKMFEIVCSKMTEFGASEKWDAKQCKKKWLELSHYPQYSNSLPITPIYTQSPVEGPGNGFYFPSPGG